jgi:hypothetical protein
MNPFNVLMNLLFLCIKNDLIHQQPTRQNIIENPCTEYKYLTPAKYLSPEQKIQFEDYRQMKREECIKKISEKSHTQNKK